MSPAKSKIVNFIGKRVIFRKLPIFKFFSDILFSTRTHYENNLFRGWLATRKQICKVLVLRILGRPDLVEESLCIRNHLLRCHAMQRGSQLNRQLNTVSLVQIHYESPLGAV